MVTNMVGVAHSLQVKVGVVKIQIQVEKITIFLP